MSASPSPTRMSAERPSVEDVAEALRQIRSDNDWAHSILSDHIAALDADAQANAKRIAGLARLAHGVDVVEIVDNDNGREGFTILGAGDPFANGATLAAALDDLVQGQERAKEWAEKVMPLEADQSISTPEEPSRG